jgi:glycosyltransferase involved in cell wall biosynthesis
VGFGQDIGACTDIRIKQPLKKIKKLGLADVHIIGPTDTDVQDQCKKADVVVLGRAFSQSVVNIINQIHVWGGKVVFDLDDNFFDISPYSPHYKDLGIMPINLDHSDGRSVKMWEDGVNGFKLKNNRQVRKDFIDTIRAVDCVTVTTEPLRKEYARFNDNVRIVPNAIDFDLWEKPRIKWGDDEVRLLYTGAANHQEDFMFIKDVLKALQDKYPLLTIVFIGTDWKVLQNNLDYSRIEVHPWVGIEAYPYLMKSLCCHIGIAPISKTKFNDCRSALKWKEYSALKMATVATDHGPYARAVKHGETGLLVDGSKDWMDALSLLIADETLRNGVALSAYKEVKRKYNLDFVCDNWTNTFKGVCNEKIPS